MNEIGLGWGDKSGDFLFTFLLLAPTVVLAFSVLQVLQAGGVVTANAFWWGVGIASYGLGVMHVMARLGVRF